MPGVPLPVPTPTPGPATSPLVTVERRLFQTCGSDHPFCVPLLGCDGHDYNFGTLEMKRTKRRFPAGPTLTDPTNCCVATQPRVSCCPGPIAATLIVSFAASAPGFIGWNGVTAAITWDGSRWTGTANVGGATWTVVLACNGATGGFILLAAGPGGVQYLFVIDSLTCSPFVLTAHTDSISAVVVDGAGLAVSRSTITTGKGVALGPPACDTDPDNCCGTVFTCDRCPNGAPRIWEIDHPNEIGFGVWWAPGIFGLFNHLGVAYVSGCAWRAPFSTFGPPLNNLGLGLWISPACGYSIEDGCCFVSAALGLGVGANNDQAILSIHDDCGGYTMGAWAMPMSQFNCNGPNTLSRILDGYHSPNGEVTPLTVTIEPWHG